MQLSDTVGGNIQAVHILGNGNKTMKSWFCNLSNEWMNMEWSFSLHCFEMSFSAFQHHDVLKM